MKKGQFQLVGVMILPEASYAWIREVTSGRTRKVEQGGTVNGMLIQQVEPERIILAQYDDMESLTLKVAPSPKTQAVEKPATASKDVAGPAVSSPQAAMPVQPMAPPESVQPATNAAPKRNPFLPVIR